MLEEPRVVDSLWKSGKARRKKAPTDFPEGYSSDYSDFSPVRPTFALLVSMTLG